MIGVVDHVLYGAASRSKPLIDVVVAVRAVTQERLKTLA
jgi:hypothetical protein